MPLYTFINPYTTHLDRPSVLSINDPDEATARATVARFLNDEYEPPTPDQPEDLALAKVQYINW